MTPADANPGQGCPAVPGAVCYDEWCVKNNSCADQLDADSRSGVAAPGSAMAPRSAAERALLAELAANARCTCGGEDRPSVHGFPPCAARLIKRLLTEIVSLQVLAEEALGPASAEPNSRLAGPVQAKQG